ncbi:helix-turn-helix domain-containing protein [Enterococcus faecium]|uniref:helix-turn-helix domain-containing protein n=1 Tax=Enterococcus TaxID=1350 RepID=UPI00032E6C85|nr:helix-turn-helix transcriptional regulator [Enterococcus faecium]EOL00986.1 hypothetical protein SIE_00495 [Enterococcus faecium EnGen0153]EOL63090.1 hypothetical protein UK3_02601 [Enterococcus faecium EnGen0305]QXJ65769.1 helix-turn-helix transcriptional regulator [Enterococcus faecium]
MSSFALRLKELRTQKKMSQEQLAQYLGMKRENISNYERGIVTNVNSETLDKLANYFNVSVDYLLGRDDSVEVKEEKNLTAVQLGGLFRSVSKKENLSDQEQEELKEDLDWYMKERARLIKERNKRG